MPTLAERKAELRGRMRALRASIPPVERTRMSGMIEARLFEVPAIADARSVLVFLSFGSEVDTAGIVGRLVEDGRRVAVPFVAHDEMHAASYRPGDPVVGSTYGAKEPAGRRIVPPGDIDLVVSPGLAFDRSGYRLGYGGGYFDRFLRRTRHGCVRTGIAFDLQVLDDVPHGHEDERIGLLITDRDTIECTSPAPAAG